MSSFNKDEVKQICIDGKHCGEVSEREIVQFMLLMPIQQPRIVIRAVEKQIKRAMK
ncbi:MAG: hypothetical protein HOP07_18600 [Bacteriovoracaceae bacterium]|nr:hypothetical protein [Bacteriovoracaceae bacterium]